MIPVVTEAAAIGAGYGTTPSVTIGVVKTHGAFGAGYGAKPRIGPVVTITAAFGAGYAATVTLTQGVVKVTPAPNAGYGAKPRIGPVVTITAAFGAGYGLATPIMGGTPFSPQDPGYGYVGRNRTARAAATVIPPLAPPPSGGSPSPGAPTTVALALSPFGIPRVSENFVRPTVINGVPYAGPMTISGVSDANPAVITVANPGHGLVSGDTVTVSGVGGATGVNGTWQVTVTSDTTFSVPVAAGGTYTSGGMVTPASLTPWRPANPSSMRSVWAKQLQIIFSGQDVTFFRNVPTEVLSWSSQEPGGDASAVVAFPSVGSLDPLPVPPALAVGNVVGIAGTYTGNGYWQAGQTGVVTAYGDAAFFGDSLGLLTKPIVGIASHPSAYGYVLVGADGGVFAYGACPFVGSASGISMVAPVVAVALTASGNGYWLLGADGGVFASNSAGQPFGDAVFHGSASGMFSYPAEQAVGIARSAGGYGYWILTNKGHVYAFGDATNHGDFSADYYAPFTALASVGGVDGFTAVNADGAAYAAGACKYYGGVTPLPLRAPINSVALTPSDGGYWMSAADGGVFASGPSGAFGNAVFLGSQPGGGLNLSGSLSWLRLGAPMQINWVDTSGGVHTLFEGTVADFDDQSGPGLHVQCVGCLFQADWYLAKPIVNLPFVGYDPDRGTPIFGWDVGAAVAAALNSPANPSPGAAVGAGPVPAERTGPYNVGHCQAVSTGILTTQRGAWDKLLTSYVTQILAQASSASGRQWTVGITRPRTPVIRMVDTETINWTIWAGGHGVNTSQLVLDQTTAETAIYGSGTAPTTFSVVGSSSVGMSATWANAKYPRIPPATPAFPLATGKYFAPGDGQTGFGVFSGWMRTCGYPMVSNDTYLNTNAATNVLDAILVQQMQQMAGLVPTGLVDKNTWDYAWQAGKTAGSVSSVYYQPLWEVAQSEPYTYNPSGDWIGENTDYVTWLPRVERYERMGQNVSKAQGMLSAALEGGRTSVPVWQGTVTLDADPVEGSRFQIAAGDNVLLKSFHGRDTLLHVSAVEAEPTSQQMTVRLTVSETPTALQTLAAVIARDTSAHGVTRKARPSLVTLNMSSSVITFDSESGAGLVPSTALSANGWTVIRVGFSEYGQIAQTNLQTSPAAAFAVAVFSGPVTPGQLFSVFSGTSPLAALPSGGGTNPWNYYAQGLAALGLLYAAGGPSGACGYWPSDPTEPNPPLTGAYQDNSTWTYAPAPGYVPWLWVAFYSTASTTVSGRFLPAPSPLA